MNYTKQNPIGLDAVIHDIQLKMYDLSSKWNVALNGYPRCYILQNHNGEKTIESYLGNQEFSGSLIFAEGNKFFFVSGEKELQVDRPFIYETTIELYFMLNTKECYPTIQHKADNEVRVDVINALSKVIGLGKVDIEANGDKVFNRFNNRISQGYEYEYTDGMVDYHYFKCMIELLPYNINKQICNNN